MSNVDPKLFAETVQAVRQLSEIAWRLQGRINALELICLQSIEDRARLDADPKAYMRGYVDRARARAKFSDVDDPGKAAQTMRELQTALDDFLTIVLERAGDIRL